MNGCRHLNLVVIANSAERLRCRNCHLTIRADELGDGYCPECFEASGRKRYDFDVHISEESGMTRYRCEDCGVMLSPYER